MDVNVILSIDENVCMKKLQSQKILTNIFLRFSRIDLGGVISYSVWTISWINNKNLLFQIFWILDNVVTHWHTSNVILFDYQQSSTFIIRLFYAFFFTVYLYVFIP